MHDETWGKGKDKGFIHDETWGKGKDKGFMPDETRGKGKDKGFTPDDGKGKGKNIQEQYLQYKATLALKPGQTTAQAMRAAAAARVPGPQPSIGKGKVRKIPEKSAAEEKPN